MFRWFRQSVPSGLTTALLITAVGTAAAHEKGILRPATREFPVGGTVRIAGEKFTQRSTLDLIIAGTHGRFRLTQVRTDSTGGFTAEVDVPANATQGAYRLLAIAADGDEVATLEIAVIAPLATTEPMEEHGEHDGTPSGEPLSLQRARSGPVTGGTAAAIGIALVLAAVLLRRQPDKV
jgi:hypothetical protein